MTGKTVTPPPTEAELEAARQRYEEAQDANIAAGRAALAANEKALAAGKECIRLEALAKPLRDHLLDDLRGLIWPSPPTLRKLAKLAHRPEAEVAACLDELVTEGLVRRDGTKYEAGETP